MRLLCVLFVFISFAAFAEPGLPKTESTFGDSVVIGTGYIVTMDKERKKCIPALNPLYNNCRYFMVTTAHQFYGKDQKVCSLKDVCFDVIKKDGKPKITIDHLNDVAVAELVPHEKILPFAQLRGDDIFFTIGSMTRPMKQGDNWTLYHFESRTNFEVLVVGDAVDSNAWHQQPFVPLAKWISSEPTPYEQKVLPIINYNAEDVVHAKQLAVSNNWVLPAQIRPGMSGAPLAVSTDSAGYIQTIMGHTVQYNKYSSESIFVKKESIIELLQTAAKGKIGEVGKLLDSSVSRTYDPKHHISYRRLKGQDTHELVWRDLIAGEDKPILVKGGGTYGDGGDSLTSLDSAMTRPGMIYNGKHALAFQLDKKRWGKESFTVVANWEALRLLDKYKSKYSFTPVAPGTDLLTLLRKRLSISKSSCKSPLVCKDQRGHHLCAKIEIKGKQLTLSYGKRGEKLQSVVINNNGALKESGEFNPLFIGDGLSVDYTGLFFIDLMNVYKEKRESAIESVRRVDCEGPKVRLSVIDTERPAGSAPVDLNFSRCE